MSSGPEHFAVIATRHIARLREITVFDPPSPISANLDVSDDAPAATKLMSAEEHYRAASELLADAKAEKVDYARSHRLKSLAETHGLLGLLAVAIWPAEKLDADA